MQKRYTLSFGFGDSFCEVKQTSSYKKVQEWVKSGKNNTWIDNYEMSEM